MSEQELLAMLRRLPISVEITSAHLDDGTVYTWQCLDMNGIAPNLIEATEKALTFLVTRLADAGTDAGAHRG